MATHRKHTSHFTPTLMTSGYAKLVTKEQALRCLCPKAQVATLEALGIWMGKCYDADSTSDVGSFLADQVLVPGSVKALAFLCMLDTALRSSPACREACRHWLPQWIPRVASTSQEHAIRYDEFFVTWAALGYIPQSVLLHRPWALDRGGSKACPTCGAHFHDDVTFACHIASHERADAERREVARCSGGVLRRASTTRAMECKLWAFVRTNGLRDAMALSGPCTVVMPSDPVGREAMCPRCGCPMIKEYDDFSRGWLWLRCMRGAAEGAVCHSECVAVAGWDEATATGASGGASAAASADDGAGVGSAGLASTSSGASSWGGLFSRRDSVHYGTNLKF